MIARVNVRRSVHTSYFRDRHTMDFAKKRTGSGRKPEPLFNPKAVEKRKKWYSEERRRGRGSWKCRFKAHLPGYSPVYGHLSGVNNKTWEKGKKHSTQRFASSRSFGRTVVDTHAHNVNSCSLVATKINSLSLNYSVFIQRTLIVVGDDDR